MACDRDLSLRQPSLVLEQEAERDSLPETEIEPEEQLQQDAPDICLLPTEGPLRTIVQTTECKSKWVFSPSTAHCPCSSLCLMLAVLCQAVGAEPICQLVQCVAGHPSRNCSCVPCRFRLLNVHTCHPATIWDGFASEPRSVPDGVTPPAAYNLVHAISQVTTLECCHGNCLCTLNAWVHASSRFPVMTATQQLICHGRAGAGLHVQAGAQDRRPEHVPSHMAAAGRNPPGATG